jgi:hypothetical protein
MAQNDMAQNDMAQNDMAQNDMAQKGINRENDPAVGLMIAKTFFLA